MENNRVPRIKFTINDLMTLQDLIDTGGIGTILFIGYRHMINPSQAMRAADDLQATVISISTVQRNHETQHVRAQAAVVVPVTVILMPFPGATDMRVLGG